MKSTKLPPGQRILNTAVMLFHRQGYNATGINQIIEESGVAKASLYQEFHSKENLCVEYLNKRHDIWFGKLKESITKSRTAKSKIIAAFDFLIRMNVEENFRGCSFLNIVSEITPAEKAILLVVQNHKRDLRDFFKSILAGQSQTTIDHVYLLFESSIVESQLFRSQWPIEKSKHIVASFIK